MTEQHERRLYEMLAQYWTPAPEKAAVKWALDRIRELENLTRSQAERIAAQSELLTRKAEHDGSNQTEIEESRPA